MATDFKILYYLFISVLGSTMLDVNSVQLSLILEHLRHRIRKLPEDQTVLGWEIMLVILLLSLANVHCLIKLNPDVLPGRRRWCASYSRSISLRSQPTATTWASAAPTISPSSASQFACSSSAWFADPRSLSTASTASLIVLSRAGSTGKLRSMWPSLSLPQIRAGESKLRCLKRRCHVHDADRCQWVDLMVPRFGRQLFCYVLLGLLDREKAFGK